MAVNKVVYGNQTLIDLSTDTVASADDILLGKVGHLRDGSVVTGTASGGDPHGTIWQDGEGYVHLDDESGIALQSKSVTPTESQQIVEADDGYYALDTVTVGAISSSYVGSGVSRRSSSDLTASGATVTAPAGYYSSSASKTVASGAVVPSIEGSDTPYIWVDSSGLIHSNGGYSATVNPVSASGWINASATTELEIGLNGTYQLSTQSAKTVTPTTSAQTAVAEGKYTTGAVTVSAMPTGTAGTPTATKGTVSNHAVSVTPSVTNTTGYITGGTKTGTAVSVSASELVSGTYNVTSSGTKDVTNYASASVPAGTAGTPTATKGTVSNHAVTVTPSVTNTAGYISGGTKTGTGVSVSASELVSGTYSVTSSGTKDVTNYASASVPAGTEGTPTATKGAVSNHSISVTPSVTNTGGYITGSTKTGTAVTVTASELVSGTKSITENGTGIDVTNYASVDVNVVSTLVYTATVSSDVTSAYVYVRVNDTGQDYSADGSTFTWTDGDNIVFRLGTSDWDSYVYVNGTLVKHSYGGYYTYTPPSKDISINMTKTSGDKITVEITYPDKMDITENGTYDVSDYESVDVNVSGGGGTSGIVTGSFTVASTISTTTDVTITTTTAIGFTPNKIIFTKDNQATTTNAINMTEWIVNGGRSQRIRATLNSSNTLTIGSNTANWTSVSAGYLSFNSSTGEIYIRVTSSYILEADTYTWIAIQ